MKIFLPFTPTWIGGSVTFSEKFKRGMERRGHQVFFQKPKEYDILFLIVQAPFKYLLEAKKENIPIVQRLDGTYYWSVSGWKYPLYNLKARIIRNIFTDFTVYQSKYSKYCAEKFLGKKRNDPSAIIYNGVDLDCFSPEGEAINLRDNNEQKIFFTVSAFRRPDQIIPIFEAVKKYQERYGSNFKLVIAGTFSGRATEIPEKYKNFNNTVFLGKIENEALPKYEREADVFLFTHLNPPCPNNIIEALACGLPVCGVADGAMPELVIPGENGLLIKTKGDAFWKPRDLNLEAFANNLRTLIENKQTYSAECRREAQKKFSLENMIKKYEESFQQLPSV